MKKIITPLIIALFMSSCQDYLDVIPKGKVIPATVQDYEELSANPSYKSGSNGLNERLSDAIYLPDDAITSSFNSYLTRAYIWKDDFYEETDADAAWNSNYSNIYNANVILENLGVVKNPDPQRMAYIKGDALCNRAFAYSNLLFQYAPLYNAVTSATDLGVPLVLVPDLEAINSRQTVEEGYQLVINDLKEAISLLPEKEKNIYRNNKYAAMAILARVYLNMGNYSESLRYANDAMKHNSSLLDYNTFSFKNPDRPHSGINNKPTNELDQEMISYQVSNFNTILNGACISPDLMSVYDAKDLRYKFKFSDLDNVGKPNIQPYPLVIRGDLNFNIGVPEMMLIVAECQARLGKKDEAVALLNKLRIKRFAPEDYQDLSAATNEDALKLVINERRLELFGKGLRWFDMKRLDKDALFAKDYKRVNEMEEFVLKQNSLKFVQQIPKSVRTINPAILPNPR